MPSPLRFYFLPSAEFLQRISRLEKSSPDFPDQLANLFRVKKSDFTANLEHTDREWFIEYLDNVLGTLNPVDPVYRKCLDELGWVCLFARRVPQSQMLNVSYRMPILNLTPFGPYLVCYEGWSNRSKVCIKILKPFLAQDWNLGARKSRLCYVIKWKYLTHSNIVPFLGFDGSTHLVSAWVSGINLTDYIVSHPDTVNPLNLLIGIASGLGCLHSLGVVHGDLGGPNIIVDDSGHPRISNFGLTAVFSAEVHDEARVCKRWASPEVLRWGISEFRSDIFSFAMVIAEVFTGRVPFFPETEPGALSALAAGKRPARPTHPDLTDVLWALAERCWNANSLNRPQSFEVIQILHDCRNERMGRDREIAQPPGSSKSTKQNSTPSENESLGKNDAWKADWFSQIENEILDLTDQVTSVALFGLIGVGKSFVARAVLDNDRTKTTFGDNCHFVHCGGLQPSSESFIKRLSEVIRLDMTQLQSRLESPPPLILVLDGVDCFLDPPVPGAKEIHAMIEEFGSYEHVCLVTTSRIYPDIQGFHRINIPTPPKGGARDIFHSLCDLNRSSTLDTLIARLDSHPLSIKLLASAIRENNWDEATLLRVWDDQTSVLRGNYYKKLKDAIEPMFHSPTIKNVGAAARDVLGAIAAFPSGIEEHQLGGIFHVTGGVGEVVDVLCRFSLVSRQDGLVRMLSPFQFYFLESMLVIGKTGEVVKWGPDCMPAKAWLPIYTQGPPEGWISDVVSRPTLRQDAGDGFPRATPVFTSGPLGSGPSHTTSRHDVPARRMWIRRLPKVIKKRLLALFGRRIKPTILVQLYEGPASIPPIETQEDPTNTPSVTPREGPASAPSIATQVDPTRAPPVALQEDPTNIPPTTPHPHEDQENISPTSPQDDPETIQSNVPQPQFSPMPGAYDVDW